MWEKVHKYFQRPAFWKLDPEVLRVHLYKSSCLQFGAGWEGSFLDLFFSCLSLFSWAYTQHTAHQTADCLFLIRACSAEKHAGKKTKEATQPAAENPFYQVAGGNKGEKPRTSSLELCWCELI